MEGGANQRPPGEGEGGREGRMKSNVGVKGEGSGPDLEQAIESRDSGSGFRIGIQDRDQLLNVID